jgi:hypothetical protein
MMTPIKQAKHTYTNEYVDCIFRSSMSATCEKIENEYVYFSIIWLGKLSFSLDLIRVKLTFRTLYKKKTEGSTDIQVVNCQIKHFIFCSSL